MFISFFQVLICQPTIVAALFMSLLAPPIVEYEFVLKNYADETSVVKSLKIDGIEVLNHEIALDEFSKKTLLAQDTTQTSIRIYRYRVKNLEMTVQKENGQEVIYSCELIERSKWQRVFFVEFGSFRSRFPAQLKSQSYYLLEDD